MLFLSGILQVGQDKRVVGNIPPTLDPHLPPDSSQLNISLKVKNLVKLLIINEPLGVRSFKWVYDIQTLNISVLGGRIYILGSASAAVRIICL